MVASRLQIYVLMLKCIDLIVNIPNLFMRFNTSLIPQKVLHVAFFLCSKLIRVTAFSIWSSRGKFLRLYSTALSKKVLTPSKKRETCSRTISPFFHIHLTCCCVISPICNLSHGNRNFKQNLDVPGDKRTLCNVVRIKVCSISSSSRQC